jgi:small redox-active disulfide protein 2
MATNRTIKKNESACCSNGDSGGKCCGKSSDTSINPDARFIVLGACCQKSTDTFNNVKQAVKELGFADEVVNVGDDLEIARYGVMQTPALVVDKKVVSYGKFLKVEDVKKIFGKLGVK